MAYSDYGAFIWKNGILKDTDLYTDTSYIYIENKGWTCTHIITEEEKEEALVIDEEKHIAKNICEGHAVIKLSEDLCLGFYKTYGVKIHNKLKFKYYGYETINKRSDIKYNKDLCISGYPLDNAECIWLYNIKYKDDVYLVVIGSGVGKGFENKHISKLLLKLVYYSPEYQWYYLRYKNKDYYPNEEMIEKALRNDRIDEEKYMIKHYIIKPLLQELYKFDFTGVLYYLKDYREHKLVIKYLK